MTKIDKALEEVWEMKKDVYNKYKKSNYSNFMDFINNEVSEFKIEHNIKNYIEKAEIN